MWALRGGEVEEWGHPEVEVEAADKGGKANTVEGNTTRGQTWGGGTVRRMSQNVNKLTNSLILSF